MTNVGEFLIGFIQ